jgi:hypothetical protein
VSDIETRDDGVWVTLSGSYQFPAFERLLGQLAPLLALTEPTPLYLDMSRISFIGPTALALILATLRRMEDLRLYDGGKFWLPVSPLTRMYLLRMDLFRQLETWVDPEEPFERRDPNIFQPLQNFSTEEDRIKVVFGLLQALVSSCKVDALAYQSTFAFLTELTENVTQHSDCSQGGCAAAQALKKRPVFEIGIVDLGIGIRDSLGKAPKLAIPADDVEAIQLALTRGVSSNFPTNSGEGLYVTAEALKANGGDLYVRSGRGEVMVGAHERGLLRTVDFPGTVVAIRARRDNPLDYHAVYNS